MTTDPIPSLPRERAAAAATSRDSRGAGQRSLRRWLPVGVLFGGALLSGVLAFTGPSIEQRSSTAPLPYVRSLRVEPTSVQLRVRTHGSVVPRTETQLIPEVSGSVVWVSPSLVSGGFFERGDVLLELDPVDAQVEVERATAQLERARAEVERTSRELARRRGLAQRNVVSENELDVAISAERVALANQREAEAVLAAARKNLERTQLHAPFDGRVRDEQVDLGQFVARGTALATLYAIDYAEVRIPIPDGELAFLDLPLMYRIEDAAVKDEKADAPSRSPERPSEDREGSAAASDAAPADVAATDAPRTDASPADAASNVRLHARFAGADHTWTGRVVRTEGELDPRTRMVNVVARVPDPYARTSDRPPLAVGLFVDVEILGREVPRAFVVPRTALRGGDHLWVIDDDDRLRLRRVSVLRVEGESAVITDGLEAGERISAAALEIAVDGMRVRTDRAERPADAPPTAPEGAAPRGDAS